MDNGLKSFQARFRGIPEQIRATIGPDLVAAAGEVAAQVRRIAPVDQGDLAASVAVTGPGQATPAYSQPGGSMVVPSNAAAITAGNTDVRYAHLVEYGTSKSAAQPFFWPAFNVTRESAVGKVKAAVRRAVRGQK